MTNEEAIYELETNVDYKTPAIKEACQTAIKALEQQPCEDCISREAVIKLLSYDWANRPAHKAVESVRNLPSVTPKEKTGWIPVSDRLPEDCQRVLVTVVRYNGNNIVRVAYYYNRNNGKGIFQIQENHEQWEVGEKGLLAWMPLPEPYKVGDTDGNSNN